MMAMRPPTSPTTVMGGFSLGINTGNKHKSKYRETTWELLYLNSYYGDAAHLHGHVLLFGATEQQDSLCVCVCPCITWDLHAGVNGSGGLDGGWGVSPIYLVWLCVLSFTVDHCYAQTQPLSKWLSPVCPNRGKFRFWTFRWLLITAFWAPSSEASRFLRKQYVNYTNRTYT